jgi:hypothetical protein
MSELKSQNLICPKCGKLGKRGNKGISVFEHDRLPLAKCHFCGHAWNPNVDENPTKHSSTVETRPSKKLLNRKKENVYYEYVRDGECEFIVERTPDKRFFQAMRTGNNFYYGIDSSKTFLYRHDNVVEANYEGKPIYIFEGEKDVDAGVELGLEATCNPMGAGKWRKEYSETLRGADVIIVPDKDKAGVEHAYLVYEELSGIANSIKAIFSPAGKDISEYIEISGDIDTFLRQIEHENPVSSIEELKRKIRIDVVPNVKIQAIDGEIFSKERINPALQYVDGMLSEGTAIIGADSGVGKTWIALQMGLSIAKGEQFLGHDTIQSEVLYLGYDDSKYRIQDRLFKILGDEEIPKNFKYTENVDEIPYADEGGIESIEHYIRQNPKCKVIFIDLLEDFFGAGGSGNAYQKDIGRFREIVRVTKEARVVIVFIHHLNKNMDMNAFNRLSGSAGIQGKMHTKIILETKLDFDGEETTIAHIKGKDIAKMEICLKWNVDNWLWELVEQSPLLKIKESHRDIMECIANLKENAVPKEIANEIGKSRGVVRNSLSTMVRANLIYRDKDDIYKIKHEYINYFN